MKVNHAKLLSEAFKALEKHVCKCGKPKSQYEEECYDCHIQPYENRLFNVTNRRNS
jgi:hypothetical protein